MSRKTANKKKKIAKKLKRSTSSNVAVIPNVNWFFASNDGGEDKGINDAGVFTFKGNIYRYLAREIIQNSLDARALASKPVTVTFNLEQISRTDIPGMDRLTDVFRKCREFWTRNTEKAFLDNALSLCAQPTITALRISDFNTNGVEGADEDRLKNRAWYTLTRCSGSSSKEEGEGGSYGLGKHAPFAASSLRTVLYSTRTSETEVAFQGVARLVTHEQSAGKKAQNIGFLGGPKGQSIRSNGEIPEGFLREELGTDVVILGFMTGKDWQDQLRLSVLENFWPAIHFGHLEVKIDDLEINKKNLATLLEASQKDEISAHYYYEAFTSKQSIRDTSTLPHLKNVDLYLHTGEAEMPKRVAMVRKSGMVIWPKQFRAAVPYCGVFLCRNDEGNSKLRAMEPPKHDIWDADFPEKSANKHIEKEFVDYIKERIRNLAVQDDSTVIAVPEVSRFLPDDEDSTEDDMGGAEQAHEDKVESFPKKPDKPIERKEIPVTKVTKSKPVVMNDDYEDGEDDGDDGDEDGDNKKETPGNGEGGQGGSGGGGGKAEKTLLPIRYRAFPTTADYSGYSVTVRSDNGASKKAMLTVQVVGDDTREIVRLNAVQTSVGKAVTHTASGKIGPITLDPKKPLRLDLTLVDARKLALEVVAHEA